MSETSKKPRTGRAARLKREIERLVGLLAQELARTGAAATNRSITFADDGPNSPYRFWAKLEMSVSVAATCNGSGCCKSD